VYPGTSLWCSSMVAFEWHLAHEYEAQVAGWHREHTPSASRWLIGNACGAWYSAGRQALVVWHDAQAENALGSWVDGLRWQAEQAVGVPWYALFAWHFPHATPRWAPVSGKSVASWSTVAPDQLLVVWHAPQVVP
jgi:hypothetical protein